MTNAQTRDEYYFLKDKFDEIQWALEGQCNDIDCDKYMYRNLIKKKYKPVLKHSYSCIKSLKWEKEAVLRLLSLPKFRKLRYKKCAVCHKKADTLSKFATIASFTRPSQHAKEYFEWNGLWVHRRCRKKMKTPKGWQKFL